MTNWYIGGVSVAERQSLYSSLPDSELLELGRAAAKKGLAITPILAAWRLAAPAKSFSLAASCIIELLLSSKSILLYMIYSNKNIENPNQQLLSNYSH
jgi:hypothetical protein